MRKPFREVASERSFQSDLLSDNEGLSDTVVDAYHPYPRINDANADVADAGWGMNDGTRTVRQEREEAQNPNLHRAGR